MELRAWGKEHGAESVGHEARGMENGEEKRVNWESAFQKMHLEKDDQLIIGDVFDDEKFEEWK